MTGKQLCSVLGDIEEDLLEECLEYRPAKSRIRPLMLAAAIALLALSTACAVIPDLREALISVFFPGYGQEEFTAIDEGHLTGSFDEDDVIMSFLDKLEREEEINIKTSSGYDYSISKISETEHEATVYCADQRTRIILRVTNIPYKQTTGLWQVSAYAVLKQ